MTLRVNCNENGYFSRVGAARCFCTLFAQKPKTARAKMSAFCSFCVHYVALNGEAVKSNRKWSLEKISSKKLLKKERAFAIIKLQHRERMFWRAVLLFERAVFSYAHGKGKVLDPLLPAAGVLTDRGDWRRLKWHRRIAFTWPSI